VARQHILNLLQGLARFGLDAPGRHFAGRGVQGDLTREEQQISGTHRLGKWQVAPRRIR
jgi:hypothetical protein